MVGHGGSSVGSYLADPTSPIPSHCASVVATSTLRVKYAVHEVSDAVTNITFIHCRKQNGKGEEHCIHHVLSQYIQEYFLHW